MSRAAVASPSGRCGGGSSSSPTSSCCRSGGATLFSPTLCVMLLARHASGATCRGAAQRGKDRSGRRPACCGCQGSGVIMACHGRSLASRSRAAASRPAIGLAGRVTSIISGSRITETKLAFGGHGTASAGNAISFTTTGRVLPVGL